MGGGPHGEFGVFRDMGVNRQLCGVAASYSPLPLASAYASVWAALASCAALYRNARSGEALGEAIEVPLASALLETLCHNSLHLDGLPEHYLSARRRRLSAGVHHDYHDVQELLDPFYASYTCRDARPIYLVCPAHRLHQERALTALGITEEARHALGVPLAQPYADEPANGIGAGQIGDEHAPAVRKLLKAAFLTRTAAEWEARLGAAGVPCAAHKSTAEWLSCEHARASGLVVEDGGAAGSVRPGPVAWVLESESPALRGRLRHRRPLHRPNVSHGSLA